MPRLGNFFPGREEKTHRGAHRGHREDCVVSLLRDHCGGVLSCFAALRRRAARFYLNVTPTRNEMAERVSSPGR